MSGNDDKRPPSDSFWDIPYTPPRINTNPTAGRHNTEAADVSSESGAAPSDDSRLRIPPRDKYAAAPAKTESAAKKSELTDDIPFSPEKSMEAQANSPTKISSENSQNQPRPLFRSAQVAPVRNAYFNGSKRRSAPESTVRETHKPELIASYKPQCSLIEKVTVYRWLSDYNFYENFCRDADRLFASHGAMCPKVNFFSYIPQYNQMNREQLAYYLYWRECVRRGEYPDADLSYVLLYIYEIINLPQRITPPDGMEMLCRIWSAYRKAYPRIDKYLAEWVCDYGLINSLPPPDDCALPFLPDVVEYATLKEYYLKIPDSTASGSLMMAQTVAEYASVYRWRDSKFVKAGTPETYALYAKHIAGAVAFVMEQTAKKGEPMLTEEHLRTVKISRDAFSGSLCAYNVKRRIDVEYLSFSRSHEFRDTVTDLVKYAENRVRGYLKIKSRLGGGSLPASYKALCDEYFDRELPKERRHSKPVDLAPEYEKLYDAPGSTLMPEHAAAIEAASWSTTEILVSDADAPDAGTPPVAETAPTIAPEAAVVPVSEPEDGGQFNLYAGLLDALDETALRDLAAVFSGGGEFERRCRESRRFADAAAEAINEAAIAASGDIIIECADGAWAVIDDYREELSECLKTKLTQ